MSLDNAVYPLNETKIAREKLTLSADFFAQLLDKTKSQEQDFAMLRNNGTFPSNDTKITDKK